MVILTGVVSRAEARAAAGRHARAVAGVVDVSNEPIAPDDGDLISADDLGRGYRFQELDASLTRAAGLRVSG